jgi:hypothetical protein
MTYARAHYTYIRYIALQLFNGFLDEALKKLIKCYIFMFYSVFIHHFSLDKKWKHYSTYLREMRI